MQHDRFACSQDDRRWAGGVPGVSERGGDPPGPIPNPVVPTASAGEVLGGQLPGKRGPRARHPAPHRRRLASSLLLDPSRRRGVEQRQLVGLITQRSWVRIPPPLPISFVDEKRYHSWWRFCVALEESELFDWSGGAHARDDRSSAVSSGKW